MKAGVPNAYSVISNGEQSGKKKHGARTTYTWTETDPIIGYLTTVAIDKFTFLRQQLADGTPPISAFGPGAEDKIAIEQKLPGVLNLPTRYFGPYPQSSGGSVFVAHQIGFSLETQDRPTYAAWADLPTIVHENGHQWWGDSMSVKTWRDVCMNKCFASYGNRFWAIPLWDMGAGNEFTNSYTRGPLFLQALRAYIGDRSFFKILRTYTQLHRGGNTSMQELERYVRKVSKKDVSSFFQAWVYGRTQPADKDTWFGPFHKPAAGQHAAAPELLQLTQQPN